MYLTLTLRGTLRNQYVEEDLEEKKMEKASLLGKGSFFR
jgi:hypothetical protein